MTEPALWLATETCGLGSYRADLVETYWKWEQDPSLMIGYGRQVPESLEARAEGMQHQLRGANIRFTVYDLSGAEPVPVGVTTLLPDGSVRTAEFGAPDELVLFCGISVGFEEEGVPRLRTGRADMAETVSFIGG